MPENVNLCLLCEDDRSTVFDLREFRDIQVVNKLCKNCGLVYQSPRMNETELENFYKSEYRQVYQGSQDPSNKDLIIQKARAEALVKILREFGVDNIDSFADIGSSSGLLLEEIREEFNCQVIGIEPGEAYRDHSEKRGLKVYESLEGVKQAGEPAFDLISMIHVVEHLPDPVNYLKRLRENFLTPDGRILIEVPNLYAHDCFEVAHLISFSRHTLFQMMKKAGYTTSFMQPHGQPRSNMIPLYITSLATPSVQSPDKSEVEEEKWIRIKRRAGLTHRRIIERLFPRQAWLPEYRG
jgi:2-polyprenyl-3-methyl-5-hydroxy-6-metoxy-1,4-benzoquinol methylase